MDSSEILGGYEVIRLLGRGAGSMIYEVKGRDGNGRYALKHVELNGPEQQRYVDQLKVEYDCSRAVSHPAVRRSHELIKGRRLLKIVEAFLVMDYVDGVSLSDRPPGSLADTVNVFLTVAEALEAMNLSGYVHADIKPANILVGPDGKVTIIDLGQACPVGIAKDRVQGTPDYIAPEQVKLRPLTAQTDMYNFGAALYWCLTGQTVPTLIASTPGEERKAPEAKGFPRPSKLNPAVPPELDHLIGDCTRTSPANRPKTWESILTRLQLIALRQKQQATILEAA